MLHRRYFVERQLRIEIRDHTSHHGNERLRIVRGANDQIRFAGAALSEWLVQVEPGVLVEVPVLDTRNDSNDSQPRVSSRSTADANAFADWILGRPVAAYDLLVDDRHRKRAFDVGILERAALQNRNAHRGKIVRRSAAHPRHLNGIIRSGFLSFYCELVAVTAATERHHL